MGSFGKVCERELKRTGKQIGGGTERNRRDSGGGEHRLDFSKVLLGRWEGGRPKGKEGEQFPSARNLCIYVIILVI